MEIEHKLDGWQIDYGYFRWYEKDKGRYKQIFPEGEFTIDLEGKIILRKKVDWAMNRVSTGSHLQMSKII